MKIIKTISLVAISAFAGLLIGQTHLAWSKPNSAKHSRSVVKSNEYVIQDPQGGSAGAMGATKNNGGLFTLSDPKTNVVSVQEIANPAAIILLNSSAKKIAFIRFAFTKNPKTHVISPIIQMMDSTGKASEMHENGKVRSIKQPNPKTWWTPEH